MTPFIQDPQDVLDYPFDWSPALGTDTIATSAFSADSGIMVESDAILNPSHTVVWLSGGTRNKRYGITNHIVTAGGREKDWTVYVLIKQQ